jgi:hypothetical protein
MLKFNVSVNDSTVIAISGDWIWIWPTKIQIITSTSILLICNWKPYMQILLCKRQPGCLVKKYIYKCERKDGKNWCWSLHLFLQALSEAVHWWWKESCQICHVQLHQRARNCNYHPTKPWLADTGKQETNG